MSDLILLLILLCYKCEAFPVMTLDTTQHLVMRITMATHGSVEQVDPKKRTVDILCGTFKLQYYLIANEVTEDGKSDFLLWTNNLQNNS